MISNCPKCNSTSINKVKWTWWGGVVGPALINSTKCESCGHTFNGETGKSNTTAIVIYSAVILVIVIIILIMSN
jgi:hypothetical protein